MWNLDSGEAADGWTRGPRSIVNLLHIFLPRCEQLHPLLTAFDLVYWWYSSRLDLRHIDVDFRLSTNFLPLIMYLSVRPAMSQISR